MVQQKKPKPKPKYMIQYDSEPKGASVICGGVNQGYAPVNLYYEILPHNTESGTINPLQCIAKWASGATALYGTSFSMVEFPNGVRTIAPRPNVEGHHIDAEFALKLEQMKYQKRQAEAAERSVWQQQQQNLLIEENNNKTTTCYTNFGITTCY